MKYFLFASSFILFATVVSAQHLRDKDFLKEVLPKDSIVYQDNISQGVVKELREAIQNNKTGVFYKVPLDSTFVLNSNGSKTIVSRRYAFTQYKPGFVVKEGRPLKDSLVLLPTERMAIETALAKMAEHKWPNVLFKKSQLISADTISKIFKPTGGRWEYLYKKGIKEIYSFTPPIFLRNNTYCFFYYDYTCGDLCGWGEFDIYKKEDGKWLKYSTLFFWIS